MTISKQEILKVAHLARLDIDQAAIDGFAEKIESILQYVDTLSQVETENVVPTAHAVFLTNAFREDEVQPHLDRDAALTNAPQKDSGSFIVPRIIG